MSFSATDNIWPEAARGHLARGRIFGQRPCDRPRTVSSKARGPTKESKQRQGPSLVRFLWAYLRPQHIVIRFVSRVMGVDHCCWRGAQAPTDHHVEELFFPFVVGAIGRVHGGFVPAASHAPPLGVQACGTNLSPSVPPRRVCAFVPPRFGPANALRRIDCPLTCSAGVRRLCVYLHSCRNLGDLF